MNKIIEKKSNKPSKDTLYCSFCGKSQHEVHKLIAGPTVFICSECVDLCDDIIWIESNSSGSRIKIKISAPTTEIEKVLQDSLLSVMSDQFPDSKPKLEYNRSVGNKNFLLFSVTKNDGGKLNDSELSELRIEVENLVNKLSVMSKKYLHSKKKYKKIERELNELKGEYLSYLRKEMSDTADEGAFELNSVMFLDIVGFSSFSDSERWDILELLRGLSTPLLSKRGAATLNMWGDAIVCTFADPTTSILIASKFIRHLSVEQFESRIGMAWGEIQIVHNKAIGRDDLNGEPVNLAARLEPLAPKGRILLSKEFGGLDLPDNSIKLIPHKVELKKGFGSFNDGDQLDTYLVNLLKN